MNRRSFITGALSAPVVITTPGLLMPVRAIEPIPIIIRNPGRFTVEALRPGTDYRLVFIGSVDNSHSFEIVSRS